MVIILLRKNNECAQCAIEKRFEWKVENSYESLFRRFSIPTLLDYQGYNLN